MVQTDTELEGAIGSLAADRGAPCEDSGATSSPMYPRSADRCELPGLWRADPRGGLGDPGRGGHGPAPIGSGPARTLARRAARCIRAARIGASCRDFWRAEPRRLRRSRPRRGNGAARIRGRPAGLWRAEPRGVEPERRLTGPKQSILRECSPLEQLSR